MAENIRIAVDIGGTFTDAVLDNGSARQTTKVLTTVDNPAVGFMESINNLLDS